MDCKLCAEKHVGPEHTITERHLRNKALHEYSSNKSKLVGNRKGIIVACNVSTNFETLSDCVDKKIKISAVPNEEVVFKFSISNDSKKEQIGVSSIKLVHTKFNFSINDDSFDGSKTYTMAPKSTLGQEVTVNFRSPNIGQYMTPVVFNFDRRATNETITIVREMVVFVEEYQTEHEKGVSPYACKEVTAKTLYRSPGVDYGKGLFHIPKNNKAIYLRSMKMSDDCPDQIRILAADIKHVFSTGVTKENYEKFFHHLLWYEETMVRLNIKRYNMSGVYIIRNDLAGTLYSLNVPGLAEKRPSLMVGDWMFVRPHKSDEVMFEAVVREINENTAVIGQLHPLFFKYYSTEARFDIRFFTSRIPLERMHVAVHHVTRLHLETRVFPVENKKIAFKTPKLNFYNPLVEDNPEQRMAVERMVCETSGAAPYLLHGPPGTGKTITIVEAILQLVNKNARNRIMVCTDSNMAADHVGTMLIKYLHMFPPGNLLLRASSKFRVWETLPECLARYSNATSRENFEPVTLEEFMSYNIVITTLSHAAKFGRDAGARKLRPITHLFIDEAAQASEPACLIPVAGLLAPSGRLVLAGDPHQLGPVVISHQASKIGLGKSLMERLMLDFPMYDHEKNNPNYVVMLRNNFRSDKEILDIPDTLFYKGQLRPCAKKDKLSDVDILGTKQPSHATMFHGVLSKEQRIGKSPSYFNNLECGLVKQYVQALVIKHKVLTQDIGIVTPYIRQVYTIKNMLRGLGYERIEVGTVEAFQGKEKRVIIISTVRANCNLLDHDAKFQLGFLVDDKRFNVAITRAKAKVIIIGNPLCLESDLKWRLYIQKCRDLGTYHGFESKDVKSEETCKELMSNIRPMLAGMKISNGINGTEQKK